MPRSLDVKELLWISKHCTLHVNCSSFPTFPLTVNRRSSWLYIPPSFLCIFRYCRNVLVLNMHEIFTAPNNPLIRTIILIACWAMSYQENVTPGFNVYCHFKNNRSSLFNLVGVFYNIMYILHEWYSLFVSLTSYFHEPIHVDIISNSSKSFRMFIVNGWFMVFQQYFSYIVAVSFICGWNRRARRKPLTCRKSLTKLIT